MSSQYEDNEFLDEYEEDVVSPNQPIQGQANEVVRESVSQGNKIIDATEQVNESTQQQVNQKSAFADAKQPLVWKISDMTSDGSPRAFNIYNAFMQNNPYQYTFYGETVANRWKENFQYILGPTNPAFVDAILSDRDIARGYCLEYNPNGILWRVSAAGIPHPDDYDNFIEQNRVIEDTNNRTTEEFNPLQMGSLIASAGMSDVDPYFTSNLKSDYNPNLPNILLEDTFKKNQIESRKQYVTTEQLEAFGWQNSGGNIVADLNDALAKFEITTPVRIRHFLAQCAKESEKGLYTMELGGRQYYIDNYWNDQDRAGDLGNLSAEDAVKFSGAGYIQMTGRYNYQKFADYIGDPEIMEGGAEYVAKKYAWMAAGFWWNNNGMNTLVDSLPGKDSFEDVNKVTDEVNRYTDSNSRTERIEYYKEIQGIIPD